MQRSADLVNRFLGGSCLSNGYTTRKPVNVQCLRKHSVDLNVSVQILRTWMNPTSSLIARRRSTP